MFPGYEEKAKEFNRIRKEWRLQEKSYQPKKHMGAIFFLESAEEMAAFYAYVDKLKVIEQEIIDMYGTEMLFRFHLKVGYSIQEGDYTWIEGIGAIDKSIAPLIQRLNQCGFFTKYCCSGVKAEHGGKTNLPYIMFDVLEEKQVSLLKTLALKHGFQIENKNGRLLICMVERNDEKVIEKWGKFEQEICGFPLSSFE